MAEGVYKTQAQAEADNRGPGRHTWQRTVLFFAVFLAKRLQRMPRAKAMHFAERLGGFAVFVTRFFFRRPQRYARRNLQITRFPRAELSRQEVDDFVRRVLVHFSKFAVDFLCGPAMTPEVVGQLVRCRGLEHVAAAREQGKGIIFVTAHFGNWELLGRFLGNNGYSMTVVAREPEDPEFAAYVHALREDGGYQVLYRGSDTVRELLRILKRKGNIGLLPDQNSGDIFVPFFGLPAGTVTGPASLALHTGAAIIPTFCARQPDDTYLALIFPPIDTRPTGDKDADVRRIMTEVNQILEGVVREYPDQWLWIHNRWKSAFEEGNRERAFPEGMPDDLRRRWEEG